MFSFYDLTNSCNHDDIWTACLYLISTLGNCNHSDIICSLFLHSFSNGNDTSLSNYCICYPKKQITDTIIGQAQLLYLLSVFLWYSAAVHSLRGCPDFRQGCCLQVRASGGHGQLTVGLLPLLRLSLGWSGTFYSFFANSLRSFCFWPSVLLTIVLGSSGLEREILSLFLMAA